MGRRTTILKTEITDVSEDLIAVDQQFIKELESKYKINYSWQFDEDGEVIFTATEVYGEIENHILALFEVAKRYDKRITGTFSYFDDQSGGAYHGLVYLAMDRTARIYEFDVDITIKTLNDVNNPLTIKEIKL